MARMIMVGLVVFLLVAVPASAQNAPTCGSPTGKPAPAFTFHKQNDSDADAKQFSDQIVQYLNTTGSIDGLQAALVAIHAENEPVFKAQVIESDMTGDNVPDILTNVTVSYGATYGEYLSLFTCSDNGYSLLDTILGGGWELGGNSIQASVIYVVDMNNDQRREIVLDYQTLVGSKGGEGLTIYEWDGSKLAALFALEPEYGTFSGVNLTNHDSNPATLELAIGQSYAYGGNVATSVGEILDWRPVDTLYQWDGTTFTLTCTYFTDEPTQLYRVLQSAETRRACGDYDAAITYYDKLWNYDELQTWDYQGWLIIPDSVEDKNAYSGNLEQTYLAAFAGYRLLQIDLATDYLTGAGDIANQIRLRYRRGTPGYGYAAMAAALWENYQVTHQLEDACAAAETAYHAAFEKGGDPGIQYYEDNINGQIIHYGFYFYNGFVYAPDPDHLFDQPESLDPFLSIPICL
jgi:hypothetical protein